MADNKKKPAHGDKFTWEKGDIEILKKGKAITKNKAKKEE